MGFPACQLGVQSKGLLSRSQPAEVFLVKAVWISHSLPARLGGLFVYLNEEDTAVEIKLSECTRARKHFMISDK